MMTEEQKIAIARFSRIAYLSGQIDGITDYAVWIDGVQMVGVMRRPLAEVLRPLLEEIDRLNEGEPT